MARYRKVDPRMWADARFRRLSREAKFLWLYLLTGPETTSLPGLINIGEAGLAEALGMDPETFREAFREVFREGLAKADWDARLVWVKNAVKYNAPASPNVIVGWADHWDNTPECGLKTEAFRTLKAFAEGLSKGFQEAFAKAIADPYRNQDQDQDQDSPPTEVAVADAATPALTLVQPEPRKAKRDPKPKQQSLSVKAPVGLAWKTWRDMYASSRRAYGGYTSAGACNGAMARVAKLAADEAVAELARRGQPGEPLEPLALEILKHWFASYLRDDGRQGFLKEKHHQIQYIQNSLTEYGTPWSKSQVVDPQVARDNYERARLAVGK